MCGIFAYLSKANIDEALRAVLYNIAMRAQHRGPDNTVAKMIGQDKYMVFHRLCINDLSDAGNQPLFHPQDNNLVVICNGEIYNYKELVKENGFKLNSSSDCEVILHMYKKYGIEKTIKSLDGVFAFVLIDRT